MADENHGTSDPDPVNDSPPVAPAPVTPPADVQQEKGSEVAPAVKSAKITFHVDPRWTEPLTMSTVALALVTLLLVVLTHFDAKEAERSASEINARIIAAQLATNKAGIDAQRANNEEIVKNQTALAQQSMEASRRQGEKSLQATATLAWFEQRPWVSVTSYDISEDQTGTQLLVRLNLANTGKTPARGVTAKIALVLDDKEPTDQDAVAYFGKLQDIPNVFDIHPGEPATFFSYRWTPPGKAIASYKEKAFRLYILALLTYVDNASFTHLTLICASHEANDPRDQIEYCSAGLNKTT